ncbi:hypothetical protein [Methylocaldum sp.]|uniref:hypothetical protein n=1 Tax=Methylocaldum sp. TaxID=1969727 RepID=UPI002D42A055|nr:hypothetical protein [Methylocaldum sp.]HYE38192.1 hypothetical protein [Methylocaldum sp.]
MSIIRLKRHEREALAAVAAEVGPHGFHCAFEHAPHNHHRVVVWNDAATWLIPVSCTPSVPHHEAANARRRARQIIAGHWRPISEQHHVQA